MIGVGSNEKVGKRHIVAVTPHKKADYYFKIIAKHYPKEHIKLKSNKHVTLSAKNQQRYKREKAKAQKITGSFNKQLVSNLIFETPIQGRISSVFGKRRVFNGKPKSPHSGIDITSPKGTPIKAAADGYIAISEAFFFNGNTIYIDHGEGVVTMYCHMHKLAKKKGDFVTQGEIIGYVGTTGRSTGPHLHFSLFLNGQTIDPAYFIAAYRLN